MKMNDTSVRGAVAGSSQGRGPLCTSKQVGRLVHINAQVRINLEPNTLLVYH